MGELKKVDMKTLQIVKRTFSGVPIHQRSDNKYLCANDLVVAYNRNRGIEDPQKRIDNYFDLNSTDDLLTALQKRKDNPLDSRDLKTPLTITKRGRNGGTYVHPLIAIDLAMWLSVDFKIWALEVLNDNLVELRHVVGDEYRELTNAITEYEKEPNVRAYVGEANMINNLVWGGTYKNKRNNATPEELALLKQLQRTDIKLIKEGRPFEDRLRILKKFKELL